MLIMKDAVLIIDMVNDFVTGKFKNERAQKIVPAIQKLIEAAHEHNVPVIYCSDSHLPADFELKIWGEHCMKNTWGAQIIPELTPQKDDFSLCKRTYCAFFQTGLDSLLRELKIENIILTGVVTDICVTNTAAAGFFNGYQEIVPPETTEPLKAETKQRDLDYMQNNYHADIMPLDKVIERWETK